MKNRTDELLCLKTLVSQTKPISVEQITNIGKLTKDYFDELELSKLQRGLHGNKTFKFYNGIMAFLNKHHGFPKERVPFELDLQDYVLADKIMKRISL